MNSRKQISSIDSSFIYSACDWLPDSSRSKLVPDRPASVTWGSHVHNTPNPRIFIVLTLAVDDRKAWVPDSRAGYHKQKTPQKTMFTATRHRGPMEFLTVRQLGANYAIPRPVLNATLKAFITLAHVRSRM